MLRIGVDNVSTGESTSKAAPGGMRMYLKALISEFLRQNNGLTVVLFTPAWADPLFEIEPQGLEVVRLRDVPINKFARILFQQTTLASAINSHRIDAFFATATILPLLVTAPAVVAIQFIQFYSMPDTYGWFRTRYLRFMLPLSIRRSFRSIIFTSASKLDLLNYTGVPAAKISVIPHGLSKEVIDAARAPQEARGKGLVLTGGSPYLLYVSATYGYKNHLRLIRAFSLLKKRMRCQHKLLLVGAESGVTYDQLRVEAVAHGVGDSVVIAGRVQSAALLYHDAELAVIPTLYETFGYPPLEAMACGCPVAASNCGSISELCDGAAELFDPMDESAIAMSVEKVISDRDYRSTLILRGKAVSARFTWESSARATLSLLEQAAEERNANPVSKS